MISSTSGITLITGALGSIGKATAQKFSAEGRSLFLVDRDPVELEKFCATLNHATCRAMDATDTKSVAMLFDDIGNHLEYVVLAVGIEGEIEDFSLSSDEIFQNVMNVNVMSVWLGLKHALRILGSKKSGSIAVLASISGTIAAPKMASYCASKHAVMGLVRTAAREYGDRNIRVNAVCPGPVDSAMMDRIDANLQERYPERLKGNANAKASIPLRRYTTPDEIADSLSFLCSPASSFITGTAFMVDGGITCR